jgi:ubiquinone biosynthesis protein Coq4
MKKLFFLPVYFEIQSTFNTLREFAVGVGFDFSRKLYLLFKKGTAWDINRKQLLSYPQSSLGFHLGCFLLKHDFCPQATCEDHDVFHVLTGFNTDTAHEIAMQYWLWGNGKRSVFVLLAMLSGVLFYPDKYSFFKNSLLRGNHSKPIHAVNYQSQLKTDVNHLYPSINNSNF